jgi:sulfate adenylyltransferase subunit 1
MLIQEKTNKMDLLRFITAGSVDDGKSTLTGRLLYDSKSIFEDQLEAIGRTTARRGGEGFDLALLTDGLQAEREQGITIDVAYRYFATPKRKFIIADAPGHEQYTRNMVTGASTANLAIILLDARKGVLTQSRRHAYIASLLGIPHLIVAINKMDLVEYSEETYHDIRGQFTPFFTKLGVRDVRFIPLSSLYGDMVVTRGHNLPWYQDDTLMEALENVKIAQDLNQRDLRFPVQWVSRPQHKGLHDFRGYMGRIESGHVKVGDEIVVLPSGHLSRVKEILAYNQNMTEAFAPQSVTLTLEHQIDISRGDMIVHPHNKPQVAKQFEAMLCWMSEQPMQTQRKYLIKHTTSTVKAILADLHYRVDINSLEQDATATDLKMNEIGRVTIKVQKPILCDSYRHNRATGGFIMIDEHTNNTVAAGMIEAV